MNREHRIDARFIKSIPTELERGVLYISIEYGAVVHSCVCGCGHEVVTPLTPTDWTLSYNGETVSLSPSIGNWGLPCRSHYWIKNGVVVWATAWKEEKIRRARTSDRQAKEDFFNDGLPENQSARKPVLERELGGRIGQILAWCQNIFGGGK